MRGPGSTGCGGGVLREPTSATSCLAVTLEVGRFAKHFSASETRFAWSTPPAAATTCSSACKVVTSLASDSKLALTSSLAARGQSLRPQVAACSVDLAMASSLAS